MKLKSLKVCRRVGREEKAEIRVRECGEVPARKSSKSAWSHSKLKSEGRALPSSERDDKSPEATPEPREWPTTPILSAVTPFAIR